MSIFKVDKTPDENYTLLMDAIRETFTGDRLTNLEKLYSDYEERIKTAPASTRINFHNAFEGGYLDHILRVIRFSQLFTTFYKKVGGDVDYTNEELMMVAIHHDLGKLGTLEEPYYLPQDNDWRRVNNLETFKHNDNRQYMDTDDLTFFILQQYGVVLTQKEYLSILLAHGGYGDKVRQYMNSFSAGPFPIRTNLCHVIHWADHMACCVEKDSVRNSL